MTESTKNLINLWILLLMPLIMIVGCFVCIWEEIDAKFNL